MSLLPPKEELLARLVSFRKAMKKEAVNAMLITDRANVRYLSGFTGDDSALLITKSKKLLLSDGRYIDEAAATAPDWELILQPQHLFEKAALYARKLNVKRLGIEAHSLTVRDMIELDKNTGESININPLKSPALNLRMVKSPWEIRQIEKALRIQEDAFGELGKIIKPGIREYEAAAELRYRMVKGGADDQSFEIMYQWGSNSSWPHGRPTGRKLKPSDIVLNDWGAKFCGYHGDLTRTFFIGRIPPRPRKIHETVLTAMVRAIDRVGPGVPFKEVDAAARDVIEKAGYGPQFNHSTGHGIGLNIHEAPSLNRKAEGSLEPGMVVTIEPGIYISGLGGVRIEEDVLVTEKGRRVLSRAPIGLRWDGSND